MKGFTRFASLALLAAVLLLQVASATPLVSGKIVLRLPYRGNLSAGGNKPYTMGMADYDVYFPFGIFMGTDWQGNIYMSDPVGTQSFVMRRFDRAGKFRESWAPTQVPFGTLVAVTKDGYIWVAVNEMASKGSGAYLLIYRSGHKQPVADWRNALPKKVKMRIDAARQSNAISQQNEEMFYVNTMTAGNHRVLVEMHHGGLGSVNQIARTAWLICDGSGKNVFGAGIAVGDEPQLSPLDTLRWSKSDFKVDPFGWNRMWFWKQGRPIGQPIIDRFKQPEPFAKFLRLGNASLPSVYKDARGNTYLIWARENHKLKPGRVVIGQKVYADVHGPPMQDECALVVLNSKQQVAAYLAWTPITFESKQSWIKPLPDGSGFYRIQYAEREARIYFYALPK